MQGIVANAQPNSSKLPTPNRSVWICSLTEEQRNQSAFLTASAGCCKTLAPHPATTPHALTECQETKRVDSTKQRKQLPQSTVEARVQGSEALRHGGRGKQATNPRGKHCRGIFVSVQCHIHITTMLLPCHICVLYGAWTLGLLELCSRCRRQNGHKAETTARATASDFRKVAAAAAVSIQRMLTYLLDSSTLLLGAHSVCERKRRQRQLSDGSGLVSSPDCNVAETIPKNGHFRVITVGLKPIH